ncbi:hypothetical protein [Neisseria animalis]|uniref:Pilus assembly protein PilP n=1 Tax=Neisseria animalis TaxID=492 RepID=A0A5P3MTQ3_NEIAN|nr:hypothetical protein [Neisseria animalis]QEY24151.1 hypothetical protein D0T90_06330 [Neisseria animalis]ROW32243.1 hypothetical protein CGZ60_06670 [Neisseria animalis]VEE06388.1 Uncharacterised protein [Neisseria animalis]
MKPLHGLFLSCLIVLHGGAWAQRQIPADMDTAVLKNVDLPYITVDYGGFSWQKLLSLGISSGQTARLPVSRFVRIKNERNRFIVIGRLGIQTGKTVALKQDGSGVVQEIWILNAAEQNQAAQRKQ